MKTIKLFLISLIAANFLLSCTKKFEEYNTDRYRPGLAEMNGDNVGTLGLIVGMQEPLAHGQQNDAQQIDQMIGGEFGGTIANINPWGNGGNFYTYNPRESWWNYPFSTIMTKTYAGYFRIRDISNRSGFIHAWAQLLRIFSMQRLSDIYGPIPYSQVDGDSYSVGYDDMATLYNYLFNDLDNVIADLSSSSVVKGQATADELAQYASVDYVYGGNFSKWLKFANTLKLRMAIRIVNAAPEFAKQMAEEAVAAGVIETVEEAAFSTLNDGYNPYYRDGQVWNDGGDFRSSANISSYMIGYSDPRINAYFKATSQNTRIGARSGCEQNATTYASNKNNTSAVNVVETDPLMIMSASESYFLRAEGKLRGWNMGAQSAKEFYEEGVKIAFAERNVPIGDYLSSVKTPASHSDPVKAEWNFSALSQATPQWNAANTLDKNLEQILIQKWIANYPNGWETWADIRRTGYPKLAPVVNNLSNSVISTEKGYQRVPYPINEYVTNTQNVMEAASFLGGPDNAATPLWWAKKN